MFGGLFVIHPEEGLCNFLVKDILSENGIAFEISKGAFGEISLSSKALKAHPCFLHHASRGNVFTPGERIDPIDCGMLKEIGNHGT